MTPAMTREPAAGSETTERLSAAVRDALRRRDFDTARGLIDAATRAGQGDPRSKVSQGLLPENWDRPVFVCGLHRSGTTLITRRLEAEYDVASLRGSGVIEAEGQFLQDVYPHERPFGGPGSFAFFRHMHFEPVVSADAADDAARRLMQQWGAHFSGGKVPLEKSPPNITRIRYLRSLFPKARFLIATRDPRAVAISTRRWSKNPLHELILHWNAAYLSAIQDLGPDCIILRYEDFCDSPDSCLADVASFCGLDRRETVADPTGRFSRIVNSNAEYIEQFRKVNLSRIRIRAWEFFGYDLT